MYRGFIKKINALDGNSIGSADLRILNMRIKRDILTKATSEFQVIGIPNAASVGDVFGVYDDSGKTVYLGVINSLENGVINTDQIIGIFDDNWKYNDYLDNSIEGKIKGIIERDFSNSQDTFQASIFNKFDVTKTTSTVNNFEYSSSRSLNFMNFLTENYDKYWVLTSIDVKYNAVRPTITIGVPTYPVIKLGNNSHALRNFEILQQEQSTNKIKVYDSKGEVLRATYYASSNGISTDSSLVGRPSKIRTQIICSDDPLNDIVAANLSSQMYSHQINVDLVLNNKLYVFDDFNLGQQFDIYYSGEYYNSILTGYEINVSGEGKAETVRLIFGKVRFTLENRIYEIANNSVDANSKVENINGTIVSMETQIVQNSEEIVLRATKEEFYGQKIGGKNYIRDSVYKDGIAYWFGVNQSYIKVEELESPNYKVLTNTNRGTSNYIYGQYTTYNYDKSRGNVDMVVSFTAYLPADGQIRVSFYINNDGWKSVGNVDIEGKAGWHEYSRSLRLYSATLSGNVIIAFNIPSGVQYMYLYHCQLEEGTKATEWKQGDTDFAEGIRLAETSIEANAEAIALRATKTEAQGYADDAESNAKTYSDSQLTVKAGEIQSNVTEQINGIATGGSNLEAFTNMGSDYWACGVGDKYYMPTTQSVTWLKTDAIKIISNGIKNSSSTNTWYIAIHDSTNAYRLNNILNPSTKYTLSYDAYYSGGADNMNFNFTNITNGAYQHPILSSVEVISSQVRVDEFGRNYRHVVRRLTTVPASNSNWSENDASLYFVMGGMDVAGAYYVVANIMLVEGTVEKAWERSIFDTESAIVTNSTNITQNANDIVLSATTLTNAINTKASQSSVDEITRAVVISSNGVDIKKNGSSTSYSHFDETGMKVYVNNNVVAEATSSQFVVEGQGGIKIQGWNLSRGSNPNILNLTKGN